MADQALAQTSALKRPGGQGSGRRYRLRYKLAWRWRAVLCWARYFFWGRRRGVPGVLDFVLGDSFFQAAQVPSELAALSEILTGYRPERALEIGTAQGGTLFLLARLASPRATIVSVDLPGEMFGGGYNARRRWFYQRFARRNQRLHLLQGDSHSTETLERVSAALAGQPLDYLLIDGDHRYDGVKRDFEMYGPLVRRGGLIVFHDIVVGPPDFVGGVPQFWREIKPQYRHVELIDDPLQGGYGIGILFVERPSSRETSTTMNQTVTTERSGEKR